MKILIISPYLPHPFSGHGGGVYLYEMVRRLSRNHAVSLVCFADTREAKLASDLQTLPIALRLVPRVKWIRKDFHEAVRLVAIRSLQLFRSVLLWQPYYVSKFRHRGMASVVSEVTGKEHFDIVQIEYAQMGQYVDDVQQGKTVLHLIDVTVRPAYRYYKEAKSVVAKVGFYIEWCRWMSYEPGMVRKFDAVSTLTEPDQMLLKRIAGLTHVEILPPGVDPPQSVPPASKRNTSSLIFVGNLAQTPNDDAAVWLCSEIFPHILQHVPHATLFIVGRSPSAALRGIARKYSQIKILDFVDNLSDYLFGCGVCIAPLRLGGGIKTKILDALAHGIAVVTTPVGAEGISGLNSSNVRIARTAPDLARHTIELLNDPEKAESLGRQGQDAVLRLYSWESILQRTVEFYGGVLRS